MNIQILREIDKLDRLGLDGVCAMLGKGMEDKSGTFNKGVGLDRMQVAHLRMFLETKDADNPLEAMKAWFRQAETVKRRRNTMAALESNVIDPETGETSWDRLLAMPVNKDETWDNGGRPATLAYCLDMIAIVLDRAVNGQGAKP